MGGQVWSTIPVVFPVHFYIPLLEFWFGLMFLKSGSNWAAVSQISKILQRWIKPEPNNENNIFVSSEAESWLLDRFPAHYVISLLSLRGAPLVDDIEWSCYESHCSASSYLKFDDPSQRFWHRKSVQICWTNELKLSSSAKPPCIYSGTIAYLQSYSSQMQNIFDFLTSIWHLVWNHILIRKLVACYVVVDQGERRVHLPDEGE